MSFHRTPLAGVLILGDRYEVTAGSLTFTLDRYPYVTGTVTIPTPPTVADLVPGLPITVLTDDGEGSLNAALSIITVETFHDRGETDLTVASDEALLAAYSQVSHDVTLRVHEMNLRTLTDVVLDRALDTALTPGGPNGSVPAHYSVTNMLENPSGTLIADGWRAGTGVTGITRQVMSAPMPPHGTTAIRFAGNAGTVNLIAGAKNFRATPGAPYVFSAWVYLRAPATHVRAAIQFWGGDDTRPMRTVYGYQAARTSGFLQVVVYAEAPAGAEYAMPFINTVGNGAGAFHYVSNAMFHEGREYVEFFHGGFPWGGGYEYYWEADSYASPSQRVSLIERPPEALIWHAGDSAWAYLEPLAASVSLRLLCDEYRRWQYIAPATYSLPGTITVSGAIAVEGSSTLDLEDEEAGWTGVLVRWKFEDAGGIPRTRTEGAGVDGRVKVLEIEGNPTPGLAAEHLERISRDRRRLRVTGASDLTARPGMQAAITLPDADPHTGRISAVTFELTTGLMTLEVDP